MKGGNYMSFVGIIACEKQVNEIKKVLSRQDKEKDIQIIAINSKSIENIVNIKFETIVIIDSIDKLYDKIECLRKIISNAEYLIINSDFSLESEILNDIEIKIITYGLKQKSTITASSIQEESIIICTQRKIRNIQDEIIEPKETKINIQHNKKIYEILAIYSIIILYNDRIGVDVLENFNFF
ncbi:MAG: hypothetical protein HFJ47_04560 [Clostridia bacterium]|nr:hypothetical protein [Clostridia bacterium]